MNKLSNISETISKKSSNNLVDINTNNIKKVGQLDNNIKDCDLKTESSNSRTSSHNLNYFVNKEKAFRKSSINVNEAVSDIFKTIEKNERDKEKNDVQLEDAVYETLDKQYFREIDHTTDNLENFRQNIRRETQGILRNTKDNTIYLDKLLTEFRKAKQTIKEIDHYKNTRDDFLPDNKETVSSLLIDTRQQLNNINDYRNNVMKMINEGKETITETKNRFTQIEEQYKIKNNKLQKDFEISFALTRKHRKSSKPFPVHDRPTKEDIDDVLERVYHYPLPLKQKDKQLQIADKYFADRQLLNDNKDKDLETGDFFDKKDEREIKSLKRKFNINRKTEIENSQKVLNDKLFKLSRKKFQLKPRNKLKVYFLVNLVYLRLKNFYESSTKDCTLSMLQWYKDNLTECNKDITNYIYENVFKTISDLYYNDKLVVDITSDFLSYSKKDVEKNKEPSFSLKKKYLSIIASIENILLVISENISKISPKSRMFLNYITSNNTIVPFKQYSLFEMVRLTEERGYLVNLGYNKIKLIFSVHLLLRILVNNVLIGKILENETDTKKHKSIYVITSVLYHLIIQTFTNDDITSKVNTKIEKYRNYEKYISNQCKEERPVPYDLEIDEEMSIEYRRAASNYYFNLRKKFHFNQDVINKLEEVNDWLGEVEQSSEDEIISYTENMLSYESLSVFFNLKEYYNYDFDNFLFSCLDNIVDYVVLK